MEGLIDPNGGLITCSKCGEILGRRKGRGKISYLNTNDRKRTAVDLESSNIKIKCRKCGTGHIFGHIEEGIKISENISAEKSKDGDR